MKKCVAALLAVHCVLPSLSHSAQTAQGRIYCLSLRFQQAANQNAYTLDLTTDGNYQILNGELAWLYTPYTHISLFVLADTLGIDPTVTGTMNINIPPFSDGNGNGFYDFFEVSRAVPSTTTSGVFTSSGGNGTISATWSRPAGSKNGTCNLSLKFPGNLT